jgi:trehalose synthase-fused probable maltokinase
VIDLLQSARWFGGKGRAIVDTRVTDRASWLCLVEVEYADSRSETYVLANDLADPGVARELLERFDGSTEPTDSGGTLTFRPTHILATVNRRAIEPIRLLGGEQSNTSIRFGNALILKVFRRIQFGPNPDAEIGRYLTEQTSFRGTPAVAGSIEYATSNREIASVGLLQCFETNHGDAWTTTLDRVASVLQGADPGASVSAMRRLGQTTAELHLALAAGQDAAFVAEPISPDDVTRWRSSLEWEVRDTVDALARTGLTIDGTALARRADGIAALEGSLKTRHHGDYHLGQVLEREDGSFVIIDFEGEPSRPLAQRREKRSPLRDVAGMLRSFDYARNAALRAFGAPSPAQVAIATAWYVSVREAFLETYLSAARQYPRLLPDDISAPLAALELEKAAYEVVYELNNRPDWLPIPLAAFRS